MRTWTLLGIMGSESPIRLVIKAKKIQEVALSVSPEDYKTLHRAEMVIAVSHDNGETHILKNRFGVSGVVKPYSYLQPS